MIYDKCEDCSVDSYTERDVCRACQLDDARKTINDLKQQLQQAHRQGWEQCKREAANTCHNHRSDYGIGGEYIADGIGRAIASMEYKEVENDR